MHPIKRLRAGRRLSLRELGSLSGVPAGTISGIERGARKPQIRTLAKIADALGVDIEELYEELPYPKDTPPRSMDELLERAGVEDRHLAMSITEIDKAIGSLPYDEALNLTRTIAEARRAVIPILAQYKGTPEEELLTAQSMERNMVAILSFQSVAGDEQGRAAVQGNTARAERIAKDIQEVKTLKEVA